MKYLSILLFSFIICSCSTSRKTVANNSIKTEKRKELNEEKQVKAIEIPTHNVHILIRVQIPYCGGASPTDTQMNSSSPYSGEIVLINHQDSSRIMVSSFENGTYYLNLEPGSYSIQETYKNVPFQQFRSSVQSGFGQYIISGVEECYIQWWKSTLIDFNVDASEIVKTINATISSSCYTGRNPCDYYTGPYPP